MSKFYHGKLNPDQGNFREKSGNLIFKIVWPPCKGMLHCKDLGVCLMLIGKFMERNKSKDTFILFSCIICRSITSYYYLDTFTLLVSQQCICTTEIICVHPVLTIKYVKIVYLCICIECFVDALKCVWQSE